MEASVIQRVKLLIESRGVTVRAFASEIDFNYSTLNNYLTGRRNTIDSELPEKILLSFGNISAEYFSQTRDVSTSGGYPKYKYTAGSLTFQAKFSDVDKFNASISGGASSEDGRTHWVIDGPATFLFSLDNRVLDANGDGILDTVQ